MRAVAAVAPAAEDPEERLSTSRPLTVAGWTVVIEVGTAKAFEPRSLGAYSMIDCPRDCASSIFTW